MRPTRAKAKVTVSLPPLWRSIHSLPRSDVNSKECIQAREPASTRDWVRWRELGAHRFNFQFFDVAAVDDDKG